MLAVINIPRFLGHVLERTSHPTMCFSITVPLKNIRRKFDLQGDEKSYQRHLLLDLLLCLLKQPCTPVYQFSHVFSCGYSAIQLWYFALLMQRECVWKKSKMKEIRTLLVDGACFLPLAAGELMLLYVPAFPAEGSLRCCKFSIADPAELMLLEAGVWRSAITATALVASRSEAGTWLPTENYLGWRFVKDKQY